MKKVKSFIKAQQERYQMVANFGASVPASQVIALLEEILQKIETEQKENKK